MELVARDCLLITIERIVHGPASAHDVPYLLHPHIIALIHHHRSRVEIEVVVACHIEEVLIIGGLHAED